ncbi:MAG: ABC transporter ATP-binding protein/permease [Oscillospiraceae bacterium]|jgi:ATP-binding cassette subfamily B protein|nr:ABC transporter ATP-binding protein/permease [Oscillospiraceae bacterium]
MNKVRQIARDFLFLFNPYWQYGKLLVVLTIVGAIIAAPVGQIASATIAQVVIDNVLAEQPLSAIIQTVILYFAVWAASYLVQNGVQDFYRGWKTEYISTRIKEIVFEQALRTDFRWIDDPQYFNQLSLTINNYANSSKNTMATMVQLLTGIATAVAMLAVIAQIGWPITLIIVIGSLLSIVIQSKMVAFQMNLMPEHMELQRKMDYATRVYQQNNYAADLKSTKIADIIGKRFNVNAKVFVNFARKLQIKLGYYAVGSAWSAKIADYCVILYVALGLLNGQIKSVGEYATIIAAAAVLSSSLSTLSFIFPQITQITQSANIIRGFFNLESKIETAGGILPPENKFEIDFNDVKFTYPNNPDFAMNGITFSIAEGEKIAIVGENGAGKTTLTKLILRLYDTDSGEILINKKNVKEYDVKALRLKIGVAFQHSNIYAATLAENLQLYNNANSVQLCEALKNNGLVDLINNIDSDVTKEFDANGLVLSGGQIQKLSLARLNCGNFGLLLLDEPSSALDPIAEYELTRQIFNRANATTTIMVAHRLSTIRHADRILVVDGGKIAEVGTHDELMSLDGKYAEMFTKQAENYTP